MAQLFTTHLFGGIEIFILTGMAYDRYVAICKPLHYAAIMSRQRCNTIILACCAGGFAHSASQFLLTIFLPFCGCNEIDHYFCDVYPLLKLACSNTHTIGLLVIANSGLIALVTFGVLFFYIVHPKGMLQGGPQQSSFHLQCPHHCRGPVFCTRIIHLHQASHNIPRRQSVCSFLHHHRSHVQPSEKHGDEGCSEESLVSSNTSG
ncbi:Hypothetical predicted protein [Marmota monax]|uniref:G-protein coupled receptors family 1 profile domain-containing protein n=1 Tax=Marmota monax TaxID=9995 RepID=A0A5E4D9B5_MARMO|nr:hypothetical protein GHT09_016789 [Marmota monax]VTJ90857.1 Hypothetical predicted protein [Marmota monax]